MFDKLKRAKSFVVKTRTKEELDLSDGSSHLRRNRVIDIAALNRQKQLSGGQQQASKPPPKSRLNRQISASHERIYDDRVILEQIRRINFGDAKRSARKEVVECYNSNNNNLGRFERKMSSERCELIRYPEVRGTNEQRAGYHQEGRALRTGEPQNTPRAAIGYGRIVNS